MYLVYVITSQTGGDNNKVHREIGNMEDNTDGVVDNSHDARIVNFPQWEIKGKTIHGLENGTGLYVVIYQQQ